jgi:hypothetical protein
LLDDVAEIRFERIVRNYKRLAEQRAVFRPADVKRMAQRGDLRQAEIVAVGLQRISQARAVQVKDKIIFRRRG